MKEKIKKFIIKNRFKLIIIFLILLLISVLIREIKFSVDFVKCAKPSFAHFSVFALEKEKG